MSHSYNSKRKTIITIISITFSPLALILLYLSLSFNCLWHKPNELERNVWTRIEEQCWECWCGKNLWLCVYLRVNKIEKVNIETEWQHHTIILHDKCGIYAGRWTGTDDMNIKTDLSRLFVFLTMQSSKETVLKYGEKSQHCRNPKDIILDF